MHNKRAARPENGWDKQNKRERLKGQTLSVCRPERSLKRPKTWLSMGKFSLEMEISQLDPATAAAKEKKIERENVAVSKGLTWSF